MTITYEDLSGSNIDPYVFEKFAAEIKDRDVVNGYVKNIADNLMKLSTYKVITFDDIYQFINWLSDKQALWELNCIKNASDDPRVHNIMDDGIKHSFNVKDVICDKCGKTMYVESIACEHGTPVRKLYRCSCVESKYVTI